MCSLLSVMLGAQVVEFLKSLFEPFSIGAKIVNLGKASTEIHLIAGSVSLLLSMLLVKGGENGAFVLRQVRQLVSA
jgi:hypothetical protein